MRTDTRSCAALPACKACTACKACAPDPGVPADEREAAGHDAAAQHARELLPGRARQRQPPLLREAAPRHVGHPLRPCERAQERPADVNYKRVRAVL